MHLYSNTQVAEHYSKTYLVFQRQFLTIQYIVVDNTCVIVAVNNTLHVSFT